MLLTESHVDVPTHADGKDGSMRIFLFHPVLPPYPEARFPGVVLFSEIYQVTGPVARFARQIAGHGYIVAAPSSYHDFTGPEALAYDAAGTDQGNAWKVAKTLQSYDEDSQVAIEHLLSLKTCNGRIGVTGMCLGGHLALRASFNEEVSACVSYFATDVHSRTLGPNSGPDTSPACATAGSPHTLDRLAVRRLRNTELALLFGTLDTHVPADGRDRIRAALQAAGVMASFHELAGAQHAFIRDELSKGRYDPALSRVCFEILLELFGRQLRSDLGDRYAVDDPSAFHQFH